MTEYLGLWSSLSSYQSSDLYVNPAEAAAQFHPHLFLPCQDLAQPTQPSSHLQTVRGVPEAFHKEEAHPEVPLLKPGSRKQAWLEAEAIFTSGAANSQARKGC